MKYDTLIFDLDGTLLDTLEDLADSLNYSLDINGFETKDIKTIRDYVGNGAKRLIELALPENTDKVIIDKCFKDFRNHYLSNMQNKTRPYPGIIELLENLFDKNYKLAIVSNKIDSAVKELNKKLFYDYIKIAIGETADMKRKPAPDMVFKAIEELDSTSQKSIYIGDSEVDIKTAKNAGMPCISVSWGFRDKEFLIKSGADYIVDKPEEIMKIIS